MLVLRKKSFLIYILLVNVDFDAIPNLDGIILGYLGN